MGYLDRNNAEGARDVYVRGLLAGTWTSNDSRRMLAMQDSPEELLKLIKEANRDPDVAGALAKMGAKEELRYPPERPRPWMAELRPGPEARTDALGGGGHKIGGGKYDPHLHPHGAKGQFAETTGGKRAKVGKEEGAAPSAKAKSVAPTGAKKATPRAPRAKAEPGAAKPKTAKAPARAKFDDSKHKATISEHKKTEAHHRGESLKIAAQQKALREQAKALPKTDKKGRAELKSQHQALNKQRDEHKAAAAQARTGRVAESKSMQEARKQHVVAKATGQAEPAKAPAPNKQSKAAPEPKAEATPAKPATRTPDASEVHSMVANDKNRGTLATEPRAGKSSKLAAVQFTKEAQAKTREHHNAVMAMYGLHNRDAGRAQASTMEIVTEKGVGGSKAQGFHWDDSGKMALSPDTAAIIGRHSQLDSRGLHSLGERYVKYGSDDMNAVNTVNAYRVSTHESIHGHGPELKRKGPFMLMDEMSTEMVARRVTGDVHGMPVHEVFGAYGRYITPAVGKLSELSGRSEAEAAHALSSAAIDFKRKSGRNLDPSKELHSLGAGALHILGVSNSDSHNEWHAHMLDVASQD